MKRCWKARPHDLEQVLAEGPEMIEIHATSEDLAKDLSVKSDLQVAVHFPEYDGQTLMDPASLDEAQRLKASNFYQRCLDKTRDWGSRFRGTPGGARGPRLRGGSRPSRASWSHGGTRARSRGTARRPVR